ncbi:hypothetical protein J4456_04070 [Candidatus Pacearchaeota archaeon]|nr:hypothetical protein [Candidatus Pacearchaeota archaeon]
MSRLIEKLIAFAENEKAIIALTKGTDPEDYSAPSEVYYFLVTSPYDAKRSDRITSLELQLVQEERLSGYFNGMA